MKRFFTRFSLASMIAAYTVLFAQHIFGQTPNDWGAFNQRIGAKDFAGMRFKLQAAVKVQLIDIEFKIRRHYQLMATPTQNVMILPTVGS